MKLGYIRVSNDTQATAPQVDALQREQCERTFVDKMAGTRFDRPQFEKLLDVARHTAMSLSSGASTGSVARSKT